MLCAKHELHLLKVSSQADVKRILSGLTRTLATATRASTARSFHTVRSHSRRHRRNSRNLPGESLYFVKLQCRRFIFPLRNRESWRGSGPVFFRDSVLSSGGGGGGYPADFGLPKATSTLPNRPSAAAHHAALGQTGRCFSPLLSGLAEEPETDIVSPVHHSSPKAPLSFQGCGTSVLSASLSE